MRDHASIPYQVTPRFFFVIFGLRLIEIQKPIEPTNTTLSARYRDTGMRNEASRQESIGSDIERPL